MFFITDLHDYSITDIYCLLNKYSLQNFVTFVVINCLPASLYFKCNFLTDIISYNMSAHELTSWFHFLYFSIKYFCLSLCFMLRFCWRPTKLEILAFAANFDVVVSFGLLLNLKIIMFTWYIKYEAFTLYNNN